MQRHDKTKYYGGQAYLTYTENGFDRGSEIMVIHDQLRALERSQNSFMGRRSTKHISVTDFTTVSLPKTISSLSCYFGYFLFTLI